MTTYQIKEIESKATKKDLIETLMFLEDKLDEVRDFIEDKKIITPSGIKHIKEILKYY